MFVVYCLLKYIETYLERASLQNDRPTTYKNHLKMSQILTYITQWSSAFDGRNDGFLRQVSLYNCNIGVGRLHPLPHPPIFNSF